VEPIVGGGGGGGGGGDGKGRAKLRRERFVQWMRWRIEAVVVVVTEAMVF